MRIGVVTESFLPQVGGLEWKVHYLATQYVKAGHEVVVFAGRPTYVLGNPPLPVEPAYRLVRCSYSMPGFGKLSIGFHLMRRAVLAYHRRTPLDVLHCHHAGGPTRVGAAVKQATGLPVVATTCGKDVQVMPELGYGDRLNARLDRIVRSNMRQIDVVGSISSAVRADLEGLSPEAEIVDIPNGVLWDDFQSGYERRLRNRLGLGDEAILVLSVGRNHPKKGYPLGLRAFAKAATGRPAVHYAFAGRGLAELEPLVDELGLRDRVHLVGQVPMTEMPDAYRSADIFFNPSFIEGFAQVNAQAMACGLPLVITDAPGNVDAGEGGGALIARSGDVDAMAAALGQLMDDPAARMSLAKASHAASQRYSWARIAQEYLEIMARLVRDSAGARA